MNEIFLTKYYHVLEILNQYTVQLETEEFCPIKQDKVAELVNLSRISVNKIFIVLREQGYIEMISREKWKVTPKGKHVIAVISNFKEEG